MYCDGRWMYRMPECAYPIDYHRRYGYMYPDMEMEIEDSMVYPIMYPDIYYRIYPYVCKVCDRMDDSNVLYPSQAHVEDMVNECYDTCTREMPDLEEYACGGMSSGDYVRSNQFRGRRPILRDLISIILISELFRRRRRRRDRRDRRNDGRYWYGY